MTGREIDAAKNQLPKWVNGEPPIFTPEQKQLDRELWCREMINSLLIYHGYDGIKKDNYFGNRHLADYVKKLGEETVSRLCDEQVKDFKKAIVRFSGVDSEGLSYKSVTWADDMLADIEKLAKAELNKNGSVGYTLPNGKYHIYIYVDDSITHADDSKTVEDGYYVIEPNRVIDGAHEPLGDTHVAEYNDFDELLKGCAWCLDEFVADREQQVKGATLDKVLKDAKAKSESAEQRGEKIIKDSIDKE